MGYLESTEGCETGTRLVIQTLRLARESKGRLVELSLECLQSILILQLKGVQEYLEQILEVLLLEQEEEKGR